MGGGNNENVWYNARFKGIYTYGLSPFYQKSVLGHLGKEFKVLFQSVIDQGKWFAPLIALGYGVVWYGNKKYHEYHRKNPNDYLPGATPSVSH